MRWVGLLAAANALQLRAAAWCDWHVANTLSGAASGSKRAAAKEQQHSAIGMPPLR